MGGRGMDNLALRGEIARYIAGEIDVRQLEAWLSGEPWEEVPEPVRGLGLEALRLVSDHSDDEDPEEEELRGRLGVLIRTYWFEQAPKTPFTASTSPVIRHVPSSASVGRRREVEFV